MENTMRFGAIVGSLLLVVFYGFIIIMAMADTWSAVTDPEYLVPLLGNGRFGWHFQSLWHYTASNVGLIGWFSLGCILCARFLIGKPPLALEMHLLATLSYFAYCFFFRFT